MSSESSKVQRTINSLSVILPSSFPVVLPPGREIKRSATKPQKVTGVAFRDVEETPRLNRSTTTLLPLPSINPKDKGKGAHVKEEPVKVKRKDQGLAQIESDAKLDQRLYKEELVEVDRAQKERQKQEEATIAVLTKEFDEIQAKIDADHELAARLTYEEQEQFTIKERAKLLAELFEKRKKQLAFRKVRGNKEQTTYKNSSQEHDDNLPQIYRADGSFKNYKIFSKMLNDFDRQDVIDLHRLVQERYDTTGPEGYDLLLWGDLKILFEPNEEDEIWKNQ
nr:hypothetical protein [Tanacetum cinerariifolium]